MKINKVSPYGKAVLKVAAVIILLLLAFALGRRSANQPISVNKELRRTQSRLQYLLMNDGSFTQVYLTNLTSYIRQLADMELYWINLQIWNQPNYGKIEEEYGKDEKAWQERLEAEINMPSDFEGGSMAPMDRNLRVTALINERIEEIKQKWMK